MTDIEQPYTPSLDEVRSDFAAVGVEMGAYSHEEGEARFDRWLAARDEAVRAEEREKTIDEAQDELVRRDAFTERSLRILDGLRAQGKEQDGV